MAKQFTFLLSCFGIIITLLLAGFNINTYFAQQKVLGAEVGANNLIEEKLFWEGVVSENPTYFSGWLELSRITYELGEEDYAVGALNSAKAIDPNSEKIKALEEELSRLTL